MRIAKVARNGRTVSAAIGPDDRATVLGDWLDGGDDAPFTAPGLTLAELDRAATTRSSEILDAGAYTLLPPAGPSAKLICLGLNYKNHVEEVSEGQPENPALFSKTADVLVGQDAPIVRPRLSQAFDYEGEIAVVIGKGGRHIPAARALDHVFGYTIMMDGSVRDFQQHSITAGKCFWHSGALGPWIVTADEIPDPMQLALTTRLNGTEVQSTTADLMIYDIGTAIAYVSGWTRLNPGDVIATGTPGGIGAMRKPPLWMKAGDVIEVEVSGIGTLRNPVIDEE